MGFERPCGVGVGAVPRSGQEVRVTESGTGERRALGRGGGGVGRPGMREFGLPAGHRDALRARQRSPTTSLLIPSPRNSPPLPLKRKWTVQRDVYHWDDPRSPRGEGLEWGEWTPTPPSLPPTAAYRGRPPPLPPAPLFLPPRPSGRPSYDLK